MDLKNFLPGQEKKEANEHYWAVMIEPGWVQAGAWRIRDEVAEVVAVSPPTAWELDDELVGVVDAVLSSATQALPEDAGEPEKTVFGVVSSWVAKGQIKEEYLEKIKKICSKLSLSPSGFVVISEAIAHYIKSEEGSPVSAVTLGVFKDAIEMSIFRLGDLVGTSQVARSVSVVDDVAEGLARFDEGDGLPSRFIIYDGREGELEEIRQTLLKANWDEFEKINFLHTPKIELIKPDRKTHAVSLAGASELADIVKVNVAKKRLGDDRKEKEVVEPEIEVASAEDVKPEDLGFILDADIAEGPTKKFKEAEVKEEKVIESPETRKIEKPKGGLLAFIKSYSFGMLGGIRKKVSTKQEFMKPRLGIKFGKKAFVFGAGFLVILVIAAFAFWLYYPKAEVTVYLSTKRLDERMTIIVDSSASEPSTAEGILPGEILTAEVSGDKTSSTTGTKTVGERARGEVTLYRVGSQLNLASGIVIKGPGDLGFTLDTAVTVASGSAGTPGTANASVTASDIGAQYNLASDAAFNVGNYSTSDIEAKNDSSFSGGSSREISAVSEKDLENLETDLSRELEDKARKELLDDLNDNLLFTEDSLTATPSSRTFSNKVGDEASTLKLSLALEVQAVVVNKEAVSELAREVLSGKVPEGFVLREDQIEADFVFVEASNGEFEFTLGLTANLLPEVNPEEILDNVAGKYPSVAEKYLTEQIPGFVRAEIKIKPRFPGRLGTLPRIEKNIEVEVAAER